MAPSSTMEGLLRVLASGPRPLPHVSTKAPAGEPAARVFINSTQPLLARAIHLFTARLLHPLLQSRQRLRTLVLAAPRFQLPGKAFEALAGALVVALSLIHI